MDGRKAINLIGISGRIESGKDTLARLIKCATFNYSTERALIQIKGFDSIKYWDIMKFATKLKQITCLLTGCTMEQLEDQEFKNSRMGPEWNTRIEISEDTYEIRGMTYREFMQKLATEGMRDKVHPNIHINGLFSSYHKPCGDADLEIGSILYNPSKWIITDVRFLNEAQAIVNHGGILIRISRGDVDDWRNARDLHPSEILLDNWSSKVKPWDYYIKNTGTLEDLYKEAYKIVETFKLA